MPYNSFPIIELSIKHIEHDLKVALAQHTKDIESYINKSIEQFCEPENLRKVVMGISQKVLTKVVQSSIDRYFTYGDGSTQVRKAVEEALRDLNLGEVDQ